MSKFIPLVSFFEGLAAGVLFIQLHNLHHNAIITTCLYTLYFVLLFRRLIALNRG